MCHSNVKDLCGGGGDSAKGNGEGDHPWGVNRSGGGHFVLSWDLGLGNASRLPLPTTLGSWSVLLGIPGAPGNGYRGPHRCPGRSYLESLQSWLSGYSRRYDVFLILPVLRPASEGNRASSPGELHPEALSEPDVNLSAHPAPIIRPMARFPVASARTALVLFWQSFRASESLAVGAWQVSCTCVAPSEPRPG